MSNSFIWIMDRTLLGATILGQNELGSNSNERLRHIPQNPCITGATQSDRLMSYPGHWPGEPYPSAVGVFYSPSQLVKKIGRF